MKLGCHCSMGAKDYLLGSVKEAISNNANCLMVYTGAPQNTRRTDIEKLKIEEAHELLKQNGMSADDIVIHAPYIMNLANPDAEKQAFAVDFLSQEIIRSSHIKAPQIVLHPGAHVNSGEIPAMNRIVDNLKQVLQNTKGLNVKIALETMAGKGTELGRSFDQLKYIIESINDDRISVCFDTCHVFDSGYDVKESFDTVIEEFDSLIGIDKITAFHINDTKNIMGSKKDRHENIGFGNIGFDAIEYIVKHPKFTNIPKILETPYVTKTDDSKDRALCPYKYEIEMIKSGTFDPELISKIRNNA